MFGSVVCTCFPSRLPPSSEAATAACCGLLPLSNTPPYLLVQQRKDCQYAPQTQYPIASPFSTGHGFLAVQACAGHHTAHTFRAFSLYRNICVARTFFVSRPTAVLRTAVELKRSKNGLGALATFISFGEATRNEHSAAGVTSESRFCTRKSRKPTHQQKRTQRAKHRRRTYRIVFRTMQHVSSRRKQSKMKGKKRGEETKQNEKTCTYAQKAARSYTTTATGYPT